MTKIPQFIIKSQGYKFLEQAMTISKRLIPANSSKFSKESTTGINFLLYFYIKFGQIKVIVMLLR